MTPLNASWFTVLPFSLQLMHADPHKLDFRSDLLARLPGAGGLGPLGPIGGALPPTHDLTRPPSLFSATGACLNMVISQGQLTECELIVILSCMKSNALHD